MHVEEISARALPVTKACSAGHTASPEIRFFFFFFFHCAHCMVDVLVLQLVQAGHGASGNLIQHFCWCWIVGKRGVWHLELSAQHMGSFHALVHIG